MVYQQLHQASIVRKDIDRPEFNGSQNSRVEIFNLIRHKFRLANTLTRDKMKMMKSNAKQTPFQGYSE